MGESVTHDVSDMVVAQRIGDLAVLPDTVNKPGMAQDPQLLRDVRLGQAGEFDELVHVPGPGGEQVHDRQANRRGKGLEQFPGRFVPIDRRPWHAHMLS